MSKQNKGSRWLVFLTIVTLMMSTAVSSAWAMEQATNASGSGSSGGSGGTTTKPRTEITKPASREKAKDAAPNVDATCMANAIDKRETAIIAAVDSYNAAVKSALSTRKDALKAAWAQTDKGKRKSALKAAWDSFKGTWKNAAATLKNSREAAWKQFQTDVKACKTDTSDDSTTSAVDSQIAT